MNIKSLFIKPADGSACGGGFCAHDSKCAKTNCEGHPRQAETLIQGDPLGVESALPITYIGSEPRRRIGWWPVVVLALLAWIAVIYGR